MAARELISAGAKQLSDECLTVLGIAPEHPELSGFAGFAYHAQMFCNRGYDTMLVIATCARLSVMNPRPPMNYFIKAIENECTKPSPTPATTTSKSERIHGSSVRPNSVLAVLDEIDRRIVGEGNPDDFLSLPKR